MKNVQFSPSAIEEFSKFKSGNQNLVFKIFELITDIQNTPFQGLGKPEGLKGNYQGFWSRRINDEHRLIYKVTDNIIIIYSCFGHY